ncbi:hypothetical protein NW768_008323 [Fusarium equiseti]|uniref:BZIP domain-containing protein n=1 Tax=Fusarium equiseti TaxID=61235 RepID=A0ABQ8R6E6_FUSEQ|nr:hypothetical protein NW768_008323 [Fusarium equiseti]
MKRSGRADHDAAQPSAKRRVLTPARREQNRLAQKAYRERRKEERKIIKEKRSRAKDNPRPRPLLKRNTPVRENDQNRRQLTTFIEPVSPSATESSNESNFPDVYLNMLQFFPTAFFGSCLANATSLGFDLDLVADCNADNVSPFFQPSISAALNCRALGSAFISSFNNTNVPLHLRPTMAQILIPHHISLDLVPLPFLRERAIMASAALPSTFNIWEMKLDIYARGGLTTWRLGSGMGEKSKDSYPPWDMKSWEAAPWFLNKWCMVMGKDYEMIQQQSIGWQVVRDMISSQDTFLGFQECLAT